MLLVDGTPLSVSNESLLSQLLNHPGTVSANSVFLDADRSPVPPSPKSICVLQGEQALVDLNLEPEGITVGSQDATTCLIVLLYCPRTSLVWTAHLDRGTCQDPALVEVLDIMHHPQLYMVGSFTEPSDESEIICTSVLRRLHASKRQVHVHLACILDANTAPNGAPRACQLAFTLLPPPQAHNTVPQTHNAAPSLDPAARSDLPISGVLPTTVHDPNAISTETPIKRDNVYTKTPNHRDGNGFGGSSKEVATPSNAANNESEAVAGSSVSGTAVGQAIDNQGLEASLSSGPATDPVTGVGPSSGPLPTAVVLPVLDGPVPPVLDGLAGAGPSSSGPLPTAAVLPVLPSLPSFEAPGRTVLVRPANFADRGPELYRRMASGSVGRGGTLAELYNTRAGCYVLPGFDAKLPSWHVFSLERLINAPDDEFLQQCSTSPDFEPAHFIDDWKCAYMWLVAAQEQDVVLEDVVYVYKHGEWVLAIKDAEGDVQEADAQLVEEPVMAGV